MNERKKKNVVYIIFNIINTISVLAFCGFLVWGIVLFFKDSEATPIYVRLGISAVSLILTIITNSYLRKRCKKCHQLLFGASYEWSVIKQKVRDIKETDGSYSHQYELDYHILYTCPNCGKVFTEKIGFTSKNGFDDCKIKMLNWCCKKFGH